MQPGIGDKFAGYLLEEELARGGMGVVYRARDMELDRIVALKLIKPDLFDNAAYRERFRAESRTAARIDHYNVVSVYEARESEGVLYLVMQFIRGHDLRAEIASQGRLDPERAVSHLQDAAAGLDAVHAAGLVHRDVKPANILIADGVGGETRALITDFGVARSATATTSMTATGQFVGTLDYVSPEQLQGGAVDARTDVYALGCLLYEALAGTVPFPGEEGATKMFGHVHGDVRPLSPALGPSVAALAPVVHRAMAKEPADRFPSAGDMGRAARAALSGQRSTVSERFIGVGDAAPASGRHVQPPPPPPLTSATSALPEPAGTVERPGPRAVRRAELSHGVPASREPRSRREGSLLLRAVAVAALVAVGVAVGAVALGGSSGSEDATTSAGNDRAREGSTTDSTVTETATSDASTVEAVDPAAPSNLAPGTYVQAATFLSDDSADEESARLTAAGVDTSVLASEDADELYPGFEVVAAGPFDSDDQVKTALKRLKKAGVDGFERELTPSTPLSGPAAVSGTWNATEAVTGELAGKGEILPFTLGLNADGTATVTYASEGCRTDLRLVAEGSSSLQYEQVPGKGDCDRGGNWFVSPGDGKLKVVYSDDGDGDGNLEYLVFDATQG